MSPIDIIFITCSSYIQSLIHTLQIFYLQLAMFDWAARNKVMLRFIEPVKPQQNGLVKSFNVRIRDEYLSEYLF